MKKKERQRAAQHKRQPRALPAYHQIRAEIMAGKLAPSTVLQEQELSTRLGASRTPIREALRMLQHDGLVAIIPRHGAAVTEISLRQIIEAYEIRELLEPYAVRLAFPHMKPEDLRLLNELHDRLPRAPASFGDVLAFDRADEELHDFLAKSSGNELLRRTVRQARIITRRAVMITAAERYARSASEHLAIISALRSGNGQEAERLVREHLRRAKARLLDRGRVLTAAPGLFGENSDGTV